MKVDLVKEVTIDGKKIKSLDLKLEDLTGADILKVDMEMRADGNPAGFNNVYDQKFLVIMASKASGILAEDLEKLSAVDFIEVTFTVRNFLMGLLDLTVEQKTSEESSSN